MTTARYKFQRIENSVAGFFSNNKANTDALNALSIWSSSKPKRYYKVVIDEDEELLADLTWHESDDSAGVDLEDAAIKFGIERLYIQKK